MVLYAAFFATYSYTIKSHAQRDRSHRSLLTRRTAHTNYVLSTTKHLPSLSILSSLFSQRSRSAIGIPHNAPRPQQPIIIPPHLS